MSHSDVYVFDTTPLTHFARADLIPELRLICDDARCVIVEEVASELKSGLDQFPENRAALDASWIEVIQLDIVQLMLFAAYTEQIGSTEGRDIGECATLAWAESRGAVGIIDDRVAVNSAEARGVEVHSTAWLITRGIRRGMFSESYASAVADRLQDTNIRFPFAKGEFIAWAWKHGVLE